jgi:predicted nucleic acid-binding protein
VKNFVVIDASPLIGLAIVDGLSWLPKLFDIVYVSETVKNEVLPGTGAQGEDVITQAFESDWLKIWQEPIIPLLDIDLDAGETDCINIAMQYTDQVLLVMDERAGRSVANEKGLKVIGTAAIIGIAKQQGLISSAREVFECLHQSSFRIAPAVIKQILDRVGE